MTVLDTEIRRLVAEVVDAAPEPPDVRALAARPQPRPPQRSKAVVALSVAIVLGALATVGLLRSARHSTGTPTTEQPPTTQLETTASPTTAAPSTTTTAPPPPAEEAVVIPPRVGPNDDRGPVLRFIGAPLDGETRMVWSVTATQQAIAECMRAAGFEYTPVPVGSDDPNWPMTGAMAEAMDGASGCERQAAARTFVANAMPAEWEELQATLRADPRYVAEADAIDQCLRAAGYEEPRDSLQDVNIQVWCSESAHMEEAIRDATEEAEAAWIVAHAARLTAIRDDIAALIAAAPSATQAVAGAMRLPDGWTITLAYGSIIGEPGLDVTQQLWGVTGTDGVSLDRLVQLSVMKAAEQQDSPADWRVGTLHADVTGEWIEGGVRFSIESEGMDLDAVQDFVEQLVPRSDDPLHGFDAPGSDMEVLTDEIGSGQPLPPEHWLEIRAVNRDGQTATMTVFDRDKPAQGLGTAQRRMMIGDRIAIMSPPEFPGFELDWNGAGLTFRVGTDTNFDDAVLLANAVAAVSDDEWHKLLLESVPAAS